MAKKGKSLSEDEMNDVANWFENERKVAVENVDVAKEALGKKEEKVSALDDMSPAKRHKKCVGKVRGDFRRPENIKRLLVFIGDDIKLGYDEKLKNHRMIKILEYYEKIYQKFRAAVNEAKASASAYPVIAAKLGGFDDPTDAVPEMTIMNENGEVDRSVVIVLTTNGEFRLPAVAVASAKQKLES